MNQILTITAKQLWDPFPNTSYLESPGFEERYQQYQNADFGFIGIQAESEMIQTRLGCETAGCQQHIGKQPTKGSPTVEYR